MNTKLFKIALSAVLIAAVAGCHSFPERLSLSEGQKEAIKQNKSPLAIVLTEDGQLLATDENGKTLERCAFGSKGSFDLKPCQGLQKDYVFENFATLLIIQSKKNPRCFTVVDRVTGTAQEICR